MLVKSRGLRPARKKAEEQHGSSARGPLRSSPRLASPGAHRANIVRVAELEVEERHLYNERARNVAVQLAGARANVQLDERESKRQR